MGMHCGPVPTLFNILEAAPGCWGANVSTTSPRQLLGSNRKVVKVSWSELSVASHKNHHTGDMLPVTEGRCKSPCQVWFTCLCKQRQLPSDNWQRSFLSHILVEQGLGARWLWSSWQPQQPAKFEWPAFSTKFLGNEFLQKHPNVISQTTRLSNDTSPG